MQQRTPQIQKSFLFDSKNVIDRLATVLNKVAALLNLDYPLEIMLTTDKYTYDNITPEQLINLPIDTLGDFEVITVRTHHGADPRMVMLVFQFTGSIFGPTGSKTLMLGSSELNQKVAQILWSELELTDLPKIETVTAQKDIVNIKPIFRNLNFQAKPNLCFVLMPFTLNWSNRVYSHIRNVCEANGWEVRRADDMYGHNIIEDIWTAINEAAYIIADTTDKNANVFYEIGVAHTLGKPTILLTQNVNDTPFDFRNYRHISYEDNVDGFRILETELPKYLLRRSAHS